jgi:hypothetical protein
VIKDQKKLHARVFSFQTHRDANYGGLTVHRKVSLCIRKKICGEQISLLKHAREGISLPNIP